MDMDEPAACVDIAGFEIERFLEPQTTGIDGLMNFLTPLSRRLLNQMDVTAAEAGMKTSWTW